jgi:hypothetical protein
MFNLAGWSHGSGLAQQALKRLSLDFALNARAGQRQLGNECAFHGAVHLTPFVSEKSFKSGRKSNLAVCGPSNPPEELGGIARDRDSASASVSKTG